MQERLHNLREAFKFSLALGLSYAIALWMDWPFPLWAGFSVLTCSLATAGASFERGLLRLVGTMIGCGLGLLLVIFFNDSALACYLAVLVILVTCALGTLTSRYWYAWLIAAFVSVLIISSAYLEWGNAFEVAVHRTSETALGIIVYMLVSALLWPQYTGPEVHRLAVSIADQLTELYGLACAEMDRDADPHAFHRCRNRLIQTVAKLDEALLAATLDTPDVRARKAEWESWRRELALFVHATLLWRESFRLLPKRHLDKLIPQAPEFRATVTEQLTRAKREWGNETSAPPSSSATLGVDHRGRDQNSSLDESHGLLRDSALYGYEDQLRSMVRSSSRLESLTSVLMGNKPVQRDTGSARASPSPTMPHVDRDLLLRVARPAVAWTLAYLAWLTLEGLPDGPGMFPFVVALSLFLSSMNSTDPMQFVKPFAVGTLMSAPLYFWVMPQLDSGYGIVGLIMLYALPWGYLGSKGNFLAKVFGVLPLLIGAGITNEQTYSFLHFADAIMMSSLAFTAIALANVFLPDSRPENVARRNLADMLNACARVLEIPLGAARSQRRLARRAARAQASVYALARRLRAPMLTLLTTADGSRAQRILELSNAIEVLSFRVGQLEHFRVDSTAVAPETISLLGDEGTRLRTELVGALRQLAHPHWQDAASSASAGLQQAFSRLERRLATLDGAPATAPLSAAQHQSLFLVLASGRLFLDALISLEQALKAYPLQPEFGDGLPAPSH